MRALVWLGSAGAVAGAVHAGVNARLLRRPPQQPPVCEHRVAILLPVRDEADQIGECLQTILAQRGVPNLGVIVLDDASTDHTQQVATAIADGDGRVRVLSGAPIPDGWLGKPFACWQLAAVVPPTTEILTFVDADVRLEPDAVAASVALLDSSGLDLVSPYPRQVAETPAERLIQPLLQWSWLTFLPLRLAERSHRPSLSAANGQFLLVRRDAYQRIGGHAAVRHAVLDDVALIRAIKRTGGRGGVVDGTAIASCRMYRDWGELRDGYAKSLWSAFGGSGAGAAAAITVLILCYVVPAVAALCGSRRLGLAGYLAGVVGRIVAARTTGGRVVPDTAAHPVSIAVLAWLTAVSISRKRAGRLQWKGRAI